MWSGSGQRTLVLTDGCIKVSMSNQFSLQYSVLPFPGLADPWPPKVQADYRWRSQEEQHYPLPRGTLQKQQLSLCSVGVGWSCCIRNSAATGLLTYCINLCASWINCILILAAICFSGLTLMVSVLLLKCTLRSRKYFLFRFLPKWLTETARDGNLWPHPPAAAQQKSRRSCLLRGSTHDENFACPAPLLRASLTRPFMEEGVRPVSVKLAEQSLLSSGSLTCTVSVSRPSILHPAAGPARAHLPGYMCNVLQHLVPAMSPCCTLNKQHFPWGHPDPRLTTQPWSCSLLHFLAFPELNPAPPKAGTAGSNGVCCRRKASG